MLYLGETLCIVVCAFAVIKGSAAGSECRQFTLDERDAESGLDFAGQHSTPALSDALHPLTL